MQDEHNADSRKRASLHKKLDIILDRGCSQLASTVSFVIESSHKIVRKKQKK